MIKKKKEIIWTIFEGPEWAFLGFFGVFLAILFLLLAEELLGWIMHNPSSNDEEQTKLW